MFQSTNHKTIGKQWENHRKMEIYPLVMTKSLLLKITIEIVENPIQDVDVPQLCLITRG